MDLKPTRNVGLDCNPCQRPMALKITGPREESATVVSLKDILSSSLLNLYAEPPYVNVVLNTGQKSLFLKGSAVNTHNSFKTSAKDK